MFHSAQPGIYYKPWANLIGYFLDAGSLVYDEGHYDDGHYDKGYYDKGHYDKSIITNGSL